MNLNRIPLAPLTPIQVQQLARLPKVQKNQNISNCQNSNQNSLEQSKCTSTNYKIKIYKKIVLELLNSISNTPQLEFLYGLHVEFMPTFRFHICPTESLLNFLNLHYDIKQLYKIYDSIFKQNVTKIKIYINNQEMDLILQLLKSIIKQKPPISQIRDVLKNQTVRDILSIKKTASDNTKSNQILNMLQCIFNSSLIKINNSIIIKKEQQENIFKDQSFNYIQSNIQQIATALFLKYCFKKQILVPEIIYSLILITNYNIVSLDPSFINDIPDSDSFDELKEKIKYKRFQRIFNLQGFVEYEDYLISEFQISYPMDNLEKDLLDNLNLVYENSSQMINRLKRIFQSRRTETTLEILSKSSESQIGLKILKTVQAISEFIKSSNTNSSKKIPKIKLKIQKL